MQDMKRTKTENTVKWIALMIAFLLLYSGGLFLASSSPEATSSTETNMAAGSLTEVLETDGTAKTRWEEMGQTIQRAFEPLVME